MPKLIDFTLISAYMLKSEMHVVFFILICTQVTPQVAAGMPPMTPDVLYGQQTSPYLPQLYTPTSYQSPLVQVSCVADLYVQYFLALSIPWRHCYRLDWCVIFPNPYNKEKAKRPLRKYSSKM